MKLINTPIALFSNNPQKIIAFPLSFLEKSIIIFNENLDKISKFDDLLVMVRGGLVPAVYLAHNLGKRNMTFFQGFKTNSDSPHDYGKVFYNLPTHIEIHKKYLIVEDIIFKGTTVYSAIDYVNKNGGEVVGVCSLVMDVNFKKIINKQIAVPLICSFICNEMAWVRFPWEKQLEDESKPVLL